MTIGPRELGALDQSIAARKASPSSSVRSSITISSSGGSGRARTQQLVDGKLEMLLVDAVGTVGRHGY